MVNAEWVWGTEDGYVTLKVYGLNAQGKRTSDVSLHRLDPATADRLAVEMVQWAAACRVLSKKGAPPVPDKEKPNAPDASV